MRKILLFLCVLVGMVWLSSCNKDNAAAPVVYKDTTISGNKIPPYNGVTLIQVQTYINRLYIDLIGRIPVPQEMDAGVKLIQSKPFSDSVRQILVSGLLNKNEYYKRFFELASARLLNATDSADIADEINQFTILQNQFLKTGDQVSADLVKFEIQKLIDLQNAQADLAAKKIDIGQFMARMLNNYFYDQVNMGTANFVKASFEGLLHRSATISEETNSENMVNGSSSTLFLKDGSTKGDFINIITTSRDFYEGQVVDAFNTYLVRGPRSDEMATYTQMIMPNKDLKPMLYKLLISKEYAGF